MTHVANITIQASQVPSDLTNFVVYVDLADLNNVGDFWTTVTLGGGDIRCFKDDGTTELAWEVISCVPGAGSTGTGELYILFTGVLSSTVDTTIQIHADGVSVEPAPTDPNGQYAVWPNSWLRMHVKGDLTNAAGLLPNSVPAGTVTGGTGTFLPDGGVQLTEAEYVRVNLTFSEFGDFTNGYRFSMWLEANSTAANFPQFMDCNSNFQIGSVGAGLSDLQCRHPSTVNTRHTDVLLDVFDQGKVKLDVWFDNANTYASVNGAAPSVLPHVGTPETSWIYLLLNMPGTLYSLHVEQAPRSTDYLVTEHLNETNTAAFYVPSAAGPSSPNIITSATVQPDGWTVDIKVSEWAAEVGDIVYDYGSNKMTLTVVSQGYSAAGALGTMTRTLYGTKTVRLPSPNEGTLDETVDGSDVVIRVSLSDPIYDDDSVAGSGTDPVVSVAAGWATHSGTTGNEAVTDLTVTNNSTLDYPKVVGQWDWDNTPAWKRVEGDFTVGFRARHEHNIAAVTLSAVGGSHTDSATLTAMQATQHASGVYSESYVHPVAIAPFTQGEKIELRAIAYPLVGNADSILDTSLNTVDDIKGLAATHCYCDKTQGMILYGTVSTTGDDGTGVVSADRATADAAPFVTAGAAAAAGSNVVLARAGTHDILGSSPVSVTPLDYYIEVRPHPEDTGINLVRGGTHTQYKASKLAYIGLTIDADAINNGGLDGENGDRQLLFENCILNTVTPTPQGLGHASKGCWFINSAIGNDNYVAAGANAVAYSFTGNTHAGAVNTDAAFTFIGNLQTTQYGTMRFAESPTANTAPKQDNVMVEHNRLMALDPATDVIDLVNLVDMEGLSFIGNLIERARTTNPALLLKIGGEGSIATLKNAIIGHNTIVGGDSEVFWNENGFSALARDNISVVGNAWRSYAIAADTYGIANGNRVGNWAQVHGVSYKDNRWDNNVGLPNDFDGLNTSYVAGSMGYADDRSVDGNGQGNGDYTARSGALIGQNNLLQYIAFDTRGNAVAGVIGAEQGITVVGSGPGISLSDVRFNTLRALGYSGSISDMLLQWLQSGPFGGVITQSNNTVPDAWRAALLAANIAAPFAPSGSQYQRNDWWFLYLGSLGYTGALPEREVAYWADLFESTTGTAYSAAYSTGYS